MNDFLGKFTLTTKNGCMIGNVIDVSIENGIIDFKCDLSVWEIPKTQDLDYDEIVFDPTRDEFTITMFPNEEE